MTDLCVFMFYLDIDECEELTHNCKIFETCANTDGSFNCVCDDGYESTLSGDSSCEG